MEDAWLILCPPHDRVVRLEETPARLYAAQHGGQVVALMREDHVAGLVQAAFEAGMKAKKMGARDGPPEVGQRDDAPSESLDQVTALGGSWAAGSAR
jgi:hypothetical protein